MTTMAGDRLETSVRVAGALRGALEALGGTERAPRRLRRAAAAVALGLGARGSGGTPLEELRRGVDQLAARGELEPDAARQARRALDRVAALLER